MLLSPMKTEKHPFPPIHKLPRNKPTEFNFWIFISPSSPKERIEPLVRARKVYCLKSSFYLQSLIYPILLKVKEKTSNESFAHLADLCSYNCRISGFAGTLSIHDLKIDFRSNKPYNPRFNLPTP